METLEALLLRSGTKQGCLLSHHSSTSYWWDETKQLDKRDQLKAKELEKKSKIISIWRWSDCVSKIKIRTLAQMFKKFNKVVGYEINIQKSIALIYIKNKGYRAEKGPP